MEYRFLDRSPETLIAISELPVEEGIAVSVRTTGYEIGTDEVVQISIVGLEGRELFAQTVKPQNIDEWSNDEASGGITPADVKDAPELYQFEDEISGLFEGASIVVAEHAEFVHEVIESSWVTLPACEKYDLSSEFCASHGTADYPAEPAVVASLSEISAYYGIACDEGSTTGRARAVAACYVALVKEHAAERLAKDPSYWEAYERQREEERRNDVQAQEEERLSQVKTLRTNAIMWLCAAAIFSNLAVQLGIRGMDFGIVAIVIAVAVFTAVRWIQCLYGLHKLRRK